MRGSYSSSGKEVQLSEHDPYYARNPSIHTVLPFDPLPDPFPSYICVYADIPWPQVEEIGFFNITRWYIPQRYRSINAEYVEE